MKFLRYVVYVLLLITCLLPIVIQAQDALPVDENDMPFPPVPGDPDFVDAPSATACAQVEGEVFVPICVTATPVTPQPTTQPASTPAIVNGLWVVRPGESSFTSSGSCQIPGGDNGGMGGEAEGVELPTIPVCMTADRQWLQVSSSSPYPEQMQGVYSQTEMRRELLTQNGETVGSLNVTSIRAYDVVSPTRIEFTYTRQEDGGCTTTSTVVYELVEANEMVCSGVIITPEVTPTFPAINVPDATFESPVTPEPQTPIRTGGYFITLPPQDDICTAEAMPDFDQIDLQFTSNQDMVIDYGMGSYTLFWDGDDYYTYENGNRFSVAVSISSDGNANFYWSKAAQPGDSPCFIYSPLVSEDAPPVTATPVPTIEPTSAPSVDAASIAGTVYTTTWDAPDYLCAAELVSNLPDLNSAILEAQADGTFLFSVEGTTYTLTNSDGIYLFVEFNDDNSMTQVTMNGFYEGLGSGIYGVVTADSKTCFAQLTFTPVQ